MYSSDFLTIVSYASTILSGIGFGFVAQQWGWDAAYATILASALAGGGVLLLIWRAPTLPFSLSRSSMESR